MGSLSPLQIGAYAQQAGIKGAALPTAIAIAMAESGGNPNALNNNPSTGDLSYGLWQINMFGDLGPTRLAQFGLSNNTELWNPQTNAQAMYAISNGGTNWSAWTTYTSGAYQQYLFQGQEAAAALAGNPVLGNSPAVAQAEAAASGQTCQHSVTAGPLGTICLDKPLALLEIGTGVMMLLIGAVLLGAAMIAGEFPGAAKVAETVAPVGVAYRVGRRVAGAQRASQGRAEASTARAQAGQARAARQANAEVRAGELHTLRVQRGRAQVRQARARARVTEGRARATKGRGNVVTLGGREVDVRTLSPRMREAIQQQAGRAS